MAKWQVGRTGGTVNVSNLRFLKNAPSPKQMQFLESTKRYVGYGGARGGGKSWAVRRKAVLLACCYGETEQQEAITILIVRRTLQELYQNHIRHLIHETRGIAQYRDKHRTLEFKNGSRIVFGYLETEKDADQYQGNEYDVVFIDEATQISEYMFNILKACVRGTKAGVPKRIYCTCNPGGKGHAYVKRLFVDRQFKDGENPDDYVFIQAKATDNEYLMKNDPEYLKQLDSLPDGLREAWRDGRWDLFVGQFFTEYDASVHECDPFPIPDHWKRYHAIDYGLDMLASVWAAVDEDGGIWIYRAIAEPNKIIPDACELMRQAEKADQCQYTRFAPPDLWGREKASGRQQSEMFAQNGFVFQKSDNDRKAGWLAVKELMAVEHTGEQKRTKLHIFRGCASNLTYALPLIQHNPKKPGDTMTEPHDLTHSPDALRYLCIMRKKLAQAVQAPARQDIRYQKMDDPVKKKFGRRKVPNIWKGLV